MLIGASLGASGSYVTLISQIIKSINKDIYQKVPYFTTFNGFSDYGQLGSVLGIILGAYVSSTLGGSTPPIDTSGNTPFHYFLGGFLLLMGARTAGGCTSGTISR